MRKNEEDLKSDLKTREEITQKSCPFNSLYLILSPVPHGHLFFNRKEDR